MAAASAFACFGGKFHAVMTAPETRDTEKKQVQKRSITHTKPVGTAEKNFVRNEYHVLARVERRMAWGEGAGNAPIETTSFASLNSEDINITAEAWTGGHS